jgi:hypothetical protein
MLSRKGRGRHSRWGYRLFLGSYRCICDDERAVPYAMGRKLPPVRPWVALLHLSVHRTLDGSAAPAAA